jgi:Tol biopolymer transport system component
VAQDRLGSNEPTERKQAMHRTIVTSLIALLGLVVPAAASAAPSTGAVVFSKSTTVEGVAKGGLFAVRDGRLNQLTEDPTDTEPAFSPDGRTIAFVRGGDLYSVRPDGSGQRRLTSGPELDSAPLVSPNGRFVVFERQASEGTASDLYKVGAKGGGIRALTSGEADDHDADFAPDGRAIVFVRAKAQGPNDSAEDLFSVRPSGAGLARLTRTAGVDEFEPRYFAGGILYSRGESSEGPAAYADVYTMRRNGTKVREQVAGVGSAYVEDVSADGRVLLFRRDQGLWAKRIGPAKARKLCQLPDGSETNGVFSSDGKRVAAFVAVEERQSLVSIDVATRRQSELAQGFEVDSKDGSVLGPVIAWQPVPVSR